VDYVVTVRFLAISQRATYDARNGACARSTTGRNT
jgi:hypothetical protein